VSGRQVAFGALIQCGRGVFCLSILRYFMPGMNQHPARSTIRRRFMIASLAAVAAACKADPPVDGGGAVGGHSAANGAVHCGLSPYAELARLDTRTPEPLSPAAAWEQKQKMMAFLEAIQQITDALAAEDWEAVARASSTLGTSPQLRPKCKQPSNGAGAIATMALEFRCRADAIGDAARERDRAAVLRATSNTLQACNGCHAVFRQDVVNTPAADR
jgi:hypothetical protein